MHVEGQEREEKEGEHEDVERGASGSGNVVLGQSSTGTTTIKSGTISLQNDDTVGGTINIKNGATSTGDINIKNGITGSGTINIANSSGTVFVNIGAGTSTGPINIGNTNASLNLAGSTIDLNAATSVGVANLWARDAASGMSLGFNVTGPLTIANGGSFAGNLDIATGSSTRTGTIKIGTAGSGAITLGNASAPLTLSGSEIGLGGNGATINVGNGGTGTTNVSSPNTNLGTFGSGKTTIFSPTIDIGRAVASTINIGLAGGTTTFATPLTLGSVPTTSAHLGFFFAGTDITAIPSSGGIIGSITLPVTGNYIVLVTLNFGNTNPTTNLYITVNSVGGTTFYGASTTVAGFLAINSTFFFSNVGSTTHNILLTYNGTPSLVNSNFITGLRVG